MVDCRIGIGAVEVEGPATALPLTPLPPGRDFSPEVVMPGFRIFLGRDGYLDLVSSACPALIVPLLALALGSAIEARLLPPNFRDIHSNIGLLPPPEPDPELDPVIAVDIG